MFDRPPCLQFLLADHAWPSPAWFITTRATRCETCPRSSMPDGEKGRKIRFFRFHVPMHGLDPDVEAPS